MKITTFYLLLAALLGITVFLTFAQQNQNTQKPNPEIEALKNRISFLESKLQTVENVEKMELAAKLAEAEAKLRNAEFGKFERELRDANDEWLRTWSTWFIAIIAIVVTILCAIGAGAWSRFKSKADQLIADSVEKSLNGFKESVAQVDILKNELKEAVGQVNILQDQIRVLEKEHAASVLGNFMHYRPEHYPEQVKTLPEQALLDVFSDETRHLELTGKAAEVLANSKSPRLISPVLKYLNSVIDSDFDWEDDFRTQYYMIALISFLRYIGTPEAYEGLKKLLEHLLTENPGDKSRVLTPTALELAYVSNELDKRDSIPILKKAIPFLKDASHENQDLKDLAEYFDRFNEPEGIKDILTNGLTTGMPDVEDRCLELLEKHDLEFVRNWKAKKEAANTQTEEAE